MIDLTPIAISVIAVVSLAITTYLIPWLKSRTTAAQRENINEWIKIAVLAAEQIYKGDHRGPEKKKYVLDYLESKGFTLDASSIDKMIEATVLELNRGVL